MGTRFLLTQDSAVPDAVKQLYLERGPDRHRRHGQGRRDAAPDAAHRSRRELEESSALRRLGPTMRRTVEFKRTSGMSWLGLARDGRAMEGAGSHAGADGAGREHPDDAPAGLVEGDTSAGVLASGQVVGVIDDLPTCEEPSTGS